MDSTVITHAASVFALFGLVWTIQLVHYPLFKYVEAPHWPRVHSFHSRNITFIVFPLMLIELLTSVQLFMEASNFTNIVSLTCALFSWLLTAAVFIPLHHRIATRPLLDVFSLLVRLNWLRTLIWTAAAGNVFAQLLEMK